MADLLHMFGAKVEDFAAATHIPVPLRRVQAGESLVHEGAPSDAIFFVRSGTFKVFRTDEDGYEQVLAFAVHKEVLGFDALCTESYPAAIQALEDSTVYVIPCGEICQLGQTLPAFSLVLQQAASLTLTRSRELVDIMAAVASEVRLARFLILLSRRMLACGQSPRRFLLRMGRREIASLLGVAHETVSRCFSALAAMGLLYVNDRTVEILDMNGLKDFSRSTRRPVEDATMASRQDPLLASGSASRRPNARRAPVTVGASPMERRTLPLAPEWSDGNAVPSDTTVRLIPQERRWLAFTARVD